MASLNSNADNNTAPIIKLNPLALNEETMPIETQNNMFEYTINSNYNMNSPIYNSNNQATPNSINRIRTRKPEQIFNNNRISRERYILRRNILNMNHNLSINEFDDLVRFN